MPELAHACNGWQEHKHEADDDSRMKGWSSWPSSTWSRFEIGIDLGAARVAASTTSHPSLCPAHCSLWPLHIARSIALLTELDTTRANSCPPPSILRVNLHRLLTTLLKARCTWEKSSTRGAVCSVNWTCWVKQLSLHERWTVQWSGQSPILGLGLPHLWSACTLNLIFTLSWNNSTESQLYCILVYSQLNIYFELKAFYWILAILYICILVYSQLNIYCEFDSRYIVYMYTCILSTWYLLWIQLDIV